MGLESQPQKLETQKVIIIPSDITNALEGVKLDPKINRQANIRDFPGAEKEFALKPKTANVENIKNDFLDNKQGGFATQLAETLPLYANLPGRVGDYFEINVTKTYKGDDQGNTFIDLVIEIKNNWLTHGAPKELQEETTEKMTFLIDVTSSYGPSLEHKMNSLKDDFLVRGKRANVICYKDAEGNTGLTRPKIVVSQSADNLEKFGTQLGECITRNASNSFTINKPDSFKRLYREYFNSLIDAIAENAASNSAYLKSLVPDPERLRLAADYDKIVKFIEVYKKTPVTKSL